MAAGLWRLPPADSDLASIENYRILYEIGRGGMASVFLAEERSGAHKRYALNTLGSLDHTRAPDYSGRIALGRGSISADRR